jgi:hypothetical protein
MGSVDEESSTWTDTSTCSGGHGGEMNHERGLAMPTPIAQKTYIGEVVSSFIIDLRRDGMPMVSVASALVAAGWVILKNELGGAKGMVAFKQLATEIIEKQN